MKQVVTPYDSSDAGKKQQVAGMFNAIARRYDFLNHFLSAGIDILWRKKAVRMLRKLKPEHILDVATGTADFAIEAASVKPRKITGVDISEGMLAVGREKLIRKKLDTLIDLQTGDSENLPFPDDTFDVVTVAFGVRNFENLDKGLAEMHRVLRPGGTLLVLEFSKPLAFPVRQLYNFYFSSVLPLIGRMVSKDQAAYNYLPASVKAFPDGKSFTRHLEACGFRSIAIRPLSFGIATIYTGIK